jgi:hypothetical protein
MKVSTQKTETEKRYQPLFFKLLCVSLFVFSFSAQAIDREKVKAKFLKSLSKYVDWPDTSIQARNGSFDLCILGENNFKGYLKKVYFQKSKIKHKPVRLLHIHQVHESKGCHLLFISRSEGNKLAEILAFTADKPILTVSEIRGFVEQNGLFQFYMNSQRVKVKGNAILFKNHALKVNPALSAVITFY